MALPDPANPTVEDLVREAIAKAAGPLPEDLAQRIVAHCLRTGDDPFAFIVDALTLHLDEVEPNGDVRPLEIAGLFEPEH